MLNINRNQVEEIITQLSLMNNVSVEQMSSYIFREFYKSTNKMYKMSKIKRFSVSITNLVKEG